MVCSLCNGLRLAQFYGYFFNYEHFSTYIANSIISGFVLSPFWFVLDGIVWGLLIGWIVTKMAGDCIDAVHGSEDVMKP